MPVSGKVVEVKNIPGRTWVNMVEKLTGKEAVDDIGFGLTKRAVISSSKQNGFVAVVPVGTGFVSSVTITVEEGTNLQKETSLHFLHIVVPT